MRKILALSVVSLAIAGVTASCFVHPQKERLFIAHRGVDLDRSIAGENSLEAIRLAARAGFQAIETDVRLSADSVLVVMHDSTLNRTCLLADGSPLTDNILVRDLTVEELQRDYILSPSGRIPTLEEYLSECAEEELLVFIEPKLVDPSGEYYRRIIALADRLLGRDGYMITSNNKANVRIRELGIHDVRLMGVLYQGSYEEIAGLGNVIMAVSASRYGESDYAAYCNRAAADGLLRESHADKFIQFDKATRQGVEFISTDLLAPDRHGQGHTVTEVRLTECDSLAFPRMAFGALYMEAEYDGKARIRLGGQDFDAEGGRMIKHQVLVHDTEPVFCISALSDDLVIKEIRLTEVEF